MTDRKGKVIAMICAQYPPNSGPGPTRMAAFAKGLAGKDYEPHVFVSEKKPGAFAVHWRKLDNISQSGDEMSGISAGRGYRQPWYNMLVNFFVPMEPTWTLSLFDLRRVFMSFAQDKKPSVIFATSNPLASAVGGTILKRRYHVPLIVEFRDPWTLNPIRNWPTRLHYYAECMLEKWVLRSADAVVMNTPTARTNLLNKYDWLDEEKVHVISHGFDGKAVISKSKPPKNDKNTPVQEVRIAYAGGFYMPDNSKKHTGFKFQFMSALNMFRSKLAYGVSNITDKNRRSSPETILKAIAEHNQAGHNRQLPRIKMDFIGGDSKQLLHFIKQLGLENDVRILPRVATSEIRLTLNDYDILFLTNPSIPMSPFIGTKTFDYLAAGRPIIAELPKSNQAQLIEAAKMGWICTPGDKEKILEVFETALANNCQALQFFTPDQEFINLFARSYQIADLSSIIEQVSGREQSQSIVSPGYRELVSNQQAQG